jgi:uncharacterized pyridoxal phosphate-containing UPF0001 family protein
MMTQENDPRPDVATNLTEVRRLISAAKNARSNSVAPVELIAVSKMHGVETIDLGLAAGHRVFGENRVQEAQI